MTDFTINAPTRQSIFLLQRANDVRAETTRRLATGLRIGRVNDGPSAFFQARGLNDRARDLLQAKDGIGQAVSAVESSLAGLDSIENLLGQLKGVALVARDGSAEQRQAAAEQFNSLRSQFDALAADAGFQGTNLISADADDLDVSLNETGSSSLTVSGRASDAASLGINAATNSFATDADIAASVAEIDTAIASLRSGASALGSSVATLQVRENFIDTLSNTLESGAGKLINADLNEEGARLLSSQVRSDLGTEGLRLAARSDASIADLL